jgi:hypothetical protein
MTEYALFISTRLEKNYDNTSLVGCTVVVYVKHRGASATQRYQEWILMQRIGAWAFRTQIKARDSNGAQLLEVEEIGVCASGLCHHASGVTFICTVHSRNTITTASSQTL